MKFSLTDETVETVAETEIVSSIYKIYKIPNVVSYEYLIHDFKTWIIEQTTNTLLHNPDYYFIIDTVYGKDAFYHWVYESAIYIPAYLELKQKYPSLKLVLSIKKTFKLIFCKFFNIPDEDILFYERDLPPTSNVCFFPSPITSSNSKNLHPSYRKLLYKFFSIFNSTVLPPTQPYDWVIMPRQTKENYIGNDRSVPLTKIINYFKENNINHFVLDTDTIEDLKVQMQIIRSAKNIILVDGAAFFVNSMFVQNKKIFVMNINHLSQTQLIIFPYMKLVFDTFRNMNGNNTQYINTEEECIAFLQLKS